MGKGRRGNGDGSGSRGRRVPFIVFARVTPRVFPAPCVAFDGPPEQKGVRTHSGQKRSAITLHYSFVASSIARARARVEMGLNRLWGPRKCDGLWRGNLGHYLQQRSDPHAPWTT